MSFIKQLKYLITVISFYFEVVLAHLMLREFFWSVVVDVHKVNLSQSRGIFFLTLDQFQPNLTSWNKSIQDCSNEGPCHNERGSNIYNNKKEGKFQIFLIKTIFPKPYPQKPIFTFHIFLAFKVCCKLPQL